MFHCVSILFLGVSHEPCVILIKWIFRNLNHNKLHLFLRKSLSYFG